MGTTTTGARRESPRRRWLGLTVVLLGLLWVSLASRAAYLRNVPVTVVQPDGAALQCLATGDEFFNWLHDARGYIIMQDPRTGFYVYARESGDALIPTAYVAGRVDPAGLGLATRPRVSRAEVEARRALLEAHPPAPAPTTGTINNLVIFVRFSDDSEFTDPISFYDDLLNNSSPGASSLKNYYQAVSYGALTLSSTFYPTPGGTVVSYQDSQPRAYYQPYNAASNPSGYSDDTERRDREHALLKSAVEAVATLVPTSLNLDGDGDGNVDNVIFVVKGSPGGWSDLLWPHRWSLYSVTATINGKRVYTYNFQLQSVLAVGVLCHEMFHSLGAPDLYHYSYDGLQPVYKWDIMEYDLNPPQHMSAYMKYRYGGWIASIPEITSPGVYSLNPLTSSTNNCYKIPSPNSSTEYYVVEYRQRTTGGFESQLPGSGLLVFRVNTAEDGNGNREGPPDELYVYRPGGTTTSDGTPAGAYYSGESGRTAINDATSPSGFLSTGSPGGLQISGIGSAAGSTISFTVGTSSGCTLTCSASAPSSASVGTPVSFQATATPSSCSGSVSYDWDFGDGSAHSSQQNPTHTYTAPATYGWTMTASVGGTTCSRTGTIAVGSGGSGVHLAWSPPAAGALNPPQNLQASRTQVTEAESSGKPTFGEGLLLPPGGPRPMESACPAPDRPESTLSETEPNGCISILGYGSDPYQTLLSGDTLMGHVEQADTEGCIQDPDGDRIEDFFVLSIGQSATYTIALTAAATTDLDLWVLTTDLHILNPACGSSYCGVTCSNPEVVQLALTPGTYVLAVNLFTGGACTAPQDSSYALAITGGGSTTPVLQGYNLYRATVDSDSSYVQLNGALVSPASTSYSDAGAPVGALYYRAKAVYDQGTSGWSNTASVGGGGCTLTCSASVPASAGKASPVAFQASATPNGCTGSATYEWDFGDGGSSTSQNASYAYTTSGTFTWTLTVRVDAAVCTKTGTISVTAPPPVVTAMRKLGSPFRISISGSNLQSGIQVYINGTPWSVTKWKNPNQVLLKGGTSLKEVVPKYTPTDFRLVNPDLGETTLTWEWP